MTIVQSEVIHSLRGLESRIVFGYITGNAENVWYGATCHCNQTDSSFERAEVIHNREWELFYMQRATKETITITPMSHLYRLFGGVRRKLSPRIGTIKRRLGINTEYPYTDFSIILPGDHSLPFFQKGHRLYDRFLPHLAKYVEPHSTVIDVGANCGDSLAAMYEANKTLSFICIEPDDVFFDFLQRNVLRIKQFDSDASISIHKSLIGKNVTDVALYGSRGTKHAVLRDGNQQNGKFWVSQTLDSLVSLTTANNIRMLKSDVDGFDYDVIDSAESLIRTHSPMIYFECQFDKPEQKSGYERIITELQTNGYGSWVMLDNFGEVVVQTENIRVVFQLLNYVGRQNSNRSTRTIFYYDILTVTNKDDALLNKIVGDYISV